MRGRGGEMTMRSERCTLHYTTLHYTALHYTTLYCTTLHYTILYYTTQGSLHDKRTRDHNTALHYTTPCFTILYYTTLHYTTRRNKSQQRYQCTTLHYTTQEGDQESPSRRVPRPGVLEPAGTPGTKCPYERPPKGG